MSFCCAIVLLALFTMVGCSPAPVATLTGVTITNLSAVSLSNVVVSGSGFAEQLGGFAARSVRKIRVHPTGDSGLRLTFDVAGQHVDSGQQAYFDSESGYRVSAVIHTDLSVSVSTRLPLGGPKRPARNDAPQLLNLTHVQEGGERFVTFEFRVPPGKQVVVTRDALVIDYGTARQFHGSPEWAKQTDPSGKTYGPGTKSILCIREPHERLLRLELETTQYSVGPRVWLWKLKRSWQTSRPSALKEIPLPTFFVRVQSELLSSYQGEPGATSTPSVIPLAEQGFHAKTQRREEE